MPKSLVVCCDGTWNTPRNHTNITRTYDFLRGRLGDAPQVVQKNGVTTCTGRARDGSDVLLFYDRGVGSQWFDKLIGGGIGVGLSDNVRDAYHFLGQNYQPGSEIYLFGFSRGAYTARSLCGFIKAAGLLENPSVKDVWRAYMDLYATASGIVAKPSGYSFGDVSKWLKEKAGDAVGLLGGEPVASLPRHHGVKIKFVGVYDTVGALGVPLGQVDKVNEPIVGFHDTTLGDLVENAVQALAVDERRGPFLPTLWTQQANAAALAGQKVLQVWFPGVHSDIGGGYEDKGIGDITLDFMMRQAVDCGLLIDPALPVPKATLQQLPVQHESFDTPWQALSNKLHLPLQATRTIGPTMPGPHGQTLTVRSEVCLHKSLVNRIGQSCTTILEDKGAQTTAEYRPANVKEGVLPVYGAR